MKKLKIFKNSKFSPDVWSKFIENADSNILPKLLSKTEAQSLLRRMSALITEETLKQNWGKFFFLYIEKSGTVYSCEGYTGCASCGHNFQVHHHIRVFNSIEDYNNFFNNELHNIDCGSHYEVKYESKKVKLNESAKYKIEEIRLIESEENYLDDSIFREKVLLTIGIENKRFDTIISVDKDSNIIPDDVYPGFEHSELNYFYQFNPSNLNQFKPEWDGVFKNMLDSEMFPFLYEKDVTSTINLLNSLI